jgi:hypothetical protein
MPAGFNTGLYNTGLPLYCPFANSKLIITPVPMAVPPNV